MLRSLGGTVLDTTVTPRTVDGGFPVGPETGVFSLGGAGGVGGVGGSGGIMGLAMCNDYTSKG
jgi:hypothetical protein